MRWLVPVIGFTPGFFSRAKMPSEDRLWFYAEHHSHHLFFLSFLTVVVGDGGGGFG